MWHPTMIFLQHEKFCSEIVCKENMFKRLSTAFSLDSIWEFELTKNLKSFMNMASKRTIKVNSVVWPNWMIFVILVKLVGMLFFNAYNNSRCNYSIPVELVAACPVYKFTKVKTVKIHSIILLVLVCQYQNKQL